VHYNYVEGGYYTKRRNRTEAQQVAMAVIEHVQRHPELSLGVATFNLQQRDLIHDILEHLQKENPWLEKAFKKNENSEYPFFIKNLENVQGDERDVIIISTTYGPDQNSGKVYQRFGPINSPVGWRRLNVIVTRAKRRLIIFTSMHSSDVRVTPGASQGVVALKKYLEFAETGKIIDLGHQTGKDPDSDFEIAVAKQLNNYGYKTSYQIGVTGFFIDIGVHHPLSEEEFILGIECDGATYHSAKSIRDRDILRQQILESKGWRIYRIWSTDWFKNKEKELKNLLGYLEKLTEAERIKVEKTKKKVTPASRDVKLFKDEPSDLNTELKQELIAFRKKYLDPICEDIKCNILSDRMIEEFIKIKPMSKSEFHKIPQAYRENIATGQTKYLDEIFEIVEEYVV
jgi:very-short-patch-repair endonuclease